MFVSVVLLLVLTALYIGMVAALKYLSPLECLDDLCQSEAVDNTIINWASDFFLAVWIFILALHLSVRAGAKGGIRKTGILSQFFMGSAFVAAGIGHWLYPNSGVDDNRGMLGYWITRIIYAFFFTMSGYAMTNFALSASDNTIPVLKRSFCANYILVHFFELLFGLSLSGFLMGSIWCSMESALQINEAVDDFESTNEMHVCFHIMNNSAMAMNFTYALLWLPVGFLLHAASQQHPEVVLGLPTTVAATFALITQWTLGSMLLVALFFVDLISPDIDYFFAWNTIYGTVLYHWAMIITMYCLHNLAYGLPSRSSYRKEDNVSYGSPKTVSNTRREKDYDSNDDEGDDVDEGPTSLSWEWWVTMVAGAVPEPKSLKEENKIKESRRNKKPNKSMTFVVEDEIDL